MLTLSLYKYKKNMIKVKYINNIKVKIEHLLKNGENIRHL